MGMWYIFIGVALVLLIIVGRASNKHQLRKKDEFLQAEGLKQVDEIPSGRYVHGHPNIDKPIKKTCIFIKDDILSIYAYLGETAVGPPTKAAEIGLALIHGISIEDASTIERRVTAARLIAFGLFAFALKKTEKKELSYLLLSWNDGRLAHEVIFEFEGKGAVEWANGARNQIVRRLGNTTAK